MSHRGHRASLDFPRSSLQTLHQELRLVLSSRVDIVLHIAHTLALRCRSHERWYHVHLSLAHHHALRYATLMLAANTKPIPALTMSTIIMIAMACTYGQREGAFSTLTKNSKTGQSNGIAHPSIRTHAFGMCAYPQVDGGPHL